MAQRQQEIVETRTMAQAGGIEHLTDLFSRLGDQVMKLLEAKFNLLTLEVKEDAAAYARGGAIFGVGAIITGVGLALINIAVAFLVATLFNFADPRINYALGFVITGLFYLVLGAIVMGVVKRRLSQHNPLPERSIEEIRKDKQWLTKEV